MRRLADDFASVDNLHALDGSREAAAVDAVDDSGLALGGGFNAADARGAVVEIDRYLSDIFPNVKNYKTLVRERW